MSVSLSRNTFIQSELCHIFYLEIFHRVGFTFHNVKLFVIISCIFKIERLKYVKSEMSKINTMYHPSLADLCWKHLTSAVDKFSMKLIWSNVGQMHSKWDTVLFMLHWTWDSLQTCICDTVFTLFLFIFVEYVVVWMRNVPHRLQYLNACFLACAVVKGDYRTFRRWKLPGGGILLGEGFQSTALLHLKFSLSASRLWLKMWSLSFMFRFPAAVPLLIDIWTLTLKSQTKMNFFHYIFLAHILSQQ